MISHRPSKAARVPTTCWGSDPQPVRLLRSEKRNNETRNKAAFWMEAWQSSICIMPIEVIGLCEAERCEKGFSAIVFYTTCAVRAVFLSDLAWSIFLGRHTWWSYAYLLMLVCYQYSWTNVPTMRSSLTRRELPVYTALHNQPAGKKLKRWPNAGLHTSMGPWVSLLSTAPDIAWRRWAARVRVGLC